MPQSAQAFDTRPRGARAGLLAAPSAPASCPSSLRRTEETLKLAKMESPSSTFVGPVAAHYTTPAFERIFVRPAGHGVDQARRVVDEVGWVPRPVGREVELSRSSRRPVMLSLLARPLVERRLGERSSRRARAGLEYAAAVAAARPPSVRAAGCIGTGMTGSAGSKLVLNSHLCPRPSDSSSKPLEEHA